MKPSLPGVPDMSLTGRFAPGEEQRYRHVPFDVPAGTRQFHVRYDYTDRIPSDPWLSGGNTLDIGVFDQQGIAAGSLGFRGWSGSDKSEFTIGASWATPPYRPGPIEPGIWFVLLGPYKIGPAGLDYRVDIWFNPELADEFPEAATVLPQARAEVPPAAEAGWLRGDLHCHTLYSDGDSWPAEVLAAAGEAGLDFLAITDHNSARRPVLANGVGGLPILIRGIETTTYGGHWNAWGPETWFEFRDPNTAGTQAAINQALAAGAFVSVNHPKPLGPPWMYPDVGGNHAIEIWNGLWAGLNTDSLRYWDDRLKRGERTIALGGSDTHKLKSAPARPLRPLLGVPTMWVRVEGEPSAASILAGLRAGNCFISASPSGPQLYFERSNGAIRARVVGGNRATLMVLSDRSSEAAFAVDADDWTQTIAYPAPAAYLRAQLIDASGTMLAVSNPIWPD